eukprot:1160487-Pelagomonas_calceolata.AAC.3
MCLYSIGAGWRCLGIVPLHPGHPAGNFHIPRADYAGSSKSWWIERIQRYGDDCDRLQGGPWHFSKKVPSLQQHSPFARIVMGVEWREAFMGCR